jgi:hypothetical protein
VNDGTQGNAMTEIALAMAMGFFSVMVLTMMSMGVGLGEKRTVESVLLAPPARADSAAADSVGKDDLLIIYDKGRYLGRDLKPLARAKIAGVQRVILAVPAELTMAGAMKARRGLDARNLVVTTLDARWRRALEDKADAGR